MGTRPTSVRTGSAIRLSTPDPRKESITMFSNHRWRHPLVSLGPLSVLVLLAGCGTRLSHDAIVRDAAGGAGGGTAVNGTTGASGGTTGTGDALPASGSSGGSATTGAGTSGSAS